MPQQPGQYQRIVDRALQMTRRRTEEPIRIAEICRAAGVSPRTLLRAFRAVHGATPYRYLCSLRLLDARRILSAATGDPPTVTEVATRFGFLELGRFAVAYRSAFGESPSATLRRSAHADLNRQDPPKIVPSLIVMNSRAASLQDGKLTLTGVAPNSIVMNCLACRSLTEAAEPSAAKAA